MEDLLKKGAWIASTKKHLDRLQYSPEVSEFSATDIAGKASNLLALLQTDAQERVPPNALDAYFTAAKIRAAEKDYVLQQLAADGRLEVCRTSSGMMEGVDIYTFSRDQVLKSASRIFDKVGPTAREVASIDALEHIAALPREEAELKEFLANVGFKDQDVALTVKLQKTLGLVGIDQNPSLDNPIIFNEHAFVEPAKVVAAYKGLSANERQDLQDIQHLIESQGCAPHETVARNFSPKMLTMMEGLGLIDRQEVMSVHGNGSFLTMPQTFGIYGGQLGLGVDCFHHAKMLLCCLKYGQIKSTSSRGRIADPSLIIRGLLRGGPVGPCTAIGQDYTVLENEGVITLSRAAHTSGQQYYMRLRKKEVGELALQVLLFNRTIEDAGIQGAIPQSSAATDYVNPQTKRANITATPTGQVAEVRSKLLATLRT